MGVGSWFRHLRQGGMFLAIGLVQLAVDTGIFVLTTWSGVPVAAGNVMGRVTAATLGFWLNGRYTFADDGRARLSARHLARFCVAWLALTGVSTLLLHWVAEQASLHQAWLAKPLVEAGMAGVGFVVWRQWVFR